MALFCRFAFLPFPNRLFRSSTLVGSTRVRVFAVGCANQLLSNPTTSVPVSRHHRPLRQNWQRESHVSPLFADARGMSLRVIRDRLHGCRTFNDSATLSEADLDSDGSVRSRWPCMSQGDSDQTGAESADCVPTGHMPDQDCCGGTKRTPHKHATHEDRVQPVPGFRPERIDDLLVRHQRTLLAEIQQNDARDETCDRAKSCKSQPGGKHDKRSTGDEVCRSTTVADLSDYRCEENPNHAGDSKQPSCLGAQMISSAQLQHENGPKGGEGTKQASL